MVDKRLEIDSWELQEYAVSVVLARHLSALRAASPSKALMCNLCLRQRYERQMRHFQWCGFDGCRDTAFGWKISPVLNRASEPFSVALTM